MTFERNAASHWHRDVPGARWFKADLHVHTIDDHAGGRAKLPTGIDGPPDAQETIAAYARCLLQRAVERQVRVLGLTPHSPRVAASAESSAVWEIVEQWNNDADDDGTPFRESIYAVFPGFEPCLKDGKSGLHLLFLFDPEIGRDLYLKAFDLIMGAEPPWRENQLALSAKSAEQAFVELRDLHCRATGKDPDDPAMATWSDDSAYTRLGGTTSRSRLTSTTRRVFSLRRRLRCWNDFSMVKSPVSNWATTSCPKTRCRTVRGCRPACASTGRRSSMAATHTWCATSASAIHG